MMRARMQGNPKVLSAGVVVARRREGEPHYLLLRAYRYWDFPKGEVRPGEAPLDTAVREVKEETGVDDLCFRWGDEYRETPPYRGGKVARYYLAESPRAPVSLPVSPELGRPEHHEHRWLPYAAARSRLAERVQPILDWAHARVEER